MESRRIKIPDGEKFAKRLASKTAAVLAFICFAGSFAGCENNKKTAEEPFSLPLDAVKVGENSYIINRKV